MGILNGRTVLVTGASSGIGMATAQAFAAEGARLVLCARRLDRLSELAASLDTDAFCLRLDVRDREAVSATLAGLPAEWAAIDVLVNNAGLSRGLSKVYENDPVDWDEMLDTNVKGILNVTRAVVPGMLERGRGHVINLGSTAGHQTYTGGTVYCASKAAERVLTEGLRLDLIGTPVRVSTVDPGMVETEFSEVRFRGDKERAAGVYRNLTPLVPADVAETIVWVASRPERVVLQSVVMTSIDQASSTVVHRRS